jgi:hypothetical protein
LLLEKAPYIIRTKEVAAMADGFDFDPERLAALNLEANLFPNETEEVMARRLMRENLVATTQRIIDLTQSSSDRTALDASKYLIDRVLGKAGEDLATAGSDKLSQFVNDLEEDLRRQAG